MKQIKENFEPYNLLPEGYDAGYWKQIKHFSYLAVDKEHINYDKAITLIK